MNICMWHVALFDIAVRCPRCAEVQLGSVAIALGPSGDLFQIWYPAHPPPPHPVYGTKCNTNF